MSKRLKIQVSGIVQGVGFRPYVYNLALKNELSGFVGNDSNGVFIEVQGGDNSVDTFLQTLQQSPPPLAFIESISSEEIDPKSMNGFHIKQSVKGEHMSTLISPDMAICDDCARELKNETDRRFRYPFINCTNCGPRYSIIFDIPYDRPNTSMHQFEMCPACQSEYEDPADRRFHAQPNACEECGPWVELWDFKRNKIHEKDYAIVLARKLLRKGNILAIKGLGGFHLACDAKNPMAVRRLRTRKNRAEKPLAVMCKNLDIARELTELSEAEINLLTSQQAPIVLAKKRDEQSQYIAPNNPRLGLMLPYTPLHYMLFNGNLDVLVMTSANLSEEPICIDNDDAFDRLRSIADFILIHNRKILQRVDDSVVIQLNGQNRIIRRSRGYVPRPTTLLHSTPTILATGGELKNTLCYSKGNQAFISQHIGDLSNTLALDFFDHTRKHLGTILEIEPEFIAYDLHPGYLSTQWALEQDNLPKIGVQHHHAHMASAMVENGLNEAVIGIALDGTGYGTDGKIWGGEVFMGDYVEVQRFAHFEYIPAPGGDKAILEPWRMGLSYLYHTFGADYQKYLPDEWSSYPVDQVVEMIAKQVNSPMTSSCGRLFDGIAAIAGGRTEITYEAQAAIEFQHLMEETDRAALKYQIVERGKHYEIQVAPIVKSVIQRLDEGASLGEMSFLFHKMLVMLFSDIADLAREQSGLNTVVLSGGVFQNSGLFEWIIPELESRGFRVFTHSEIPTNDGGISLGQIAIAQTLIAKNKNQANISYS